MQIVTSAQGPWTVLGLTGKIDNAGADELKAALAPHLGGGEVAVDFTGVEYITSVGFRVLLSALKAITAAHGRLLLGNMNEHVRGYFEMAGLGTVFKITASIYDVVPPTA